MQDIELLAFGPVPSRRLGRSLGINNVLWKTCTYSCVYCQLGRTNCMFIERRAFYEPKQVLAQVEKKIKEAKLRGERIDYITFAPSGEPTLDVNLGKEISLLKSLGYPIAVITNASLLWRSDVREDLLDADYLSFKVDAISRGLWKCINRPHGDLELGDILDGIKDLSKTFKGSLVSETMLIDSINYEGELLRIANFLKSLSKLNKAYIAIPTRPPAEKWVRPAKEAIINEALQIFVEKLGNDRVECLTSYEKNTFALTGDIERDLLSVAAAHPIRREAVIELLKKANADWRVVERLLEEGKLVELEYRGTKYYVKRNLVANS
ncbi:MAG: radical SAM protein [Candidatus Nezhaarchaeales archaeon]